MDMRMLSKFYWKRVHVSMHMTFFDELHCTILLAGDMRGLSGFYSRKGQM
jgi:hypothetical protein